MAQFIQTQYKEFVNLDNILTFDISYNEQFKVWYAVAYYPGSYTGNHSYISSTIGAFKTEKEAKKAIREVIRRSNHPEEYPNGLLADFTVEGGPY